MRGRPTLTCVDLMHRIRKIHFNRKTGPQELPLHQIDAVVRNIWISHQVAKKKSSFFAQFFSEIAQILGALPNQKKCSLLSSNLHAHTIHSGYGVSERRTVQMDEYFIRTREKPEVVPTL